MLPSDNIKLGSIELIEVIELNVTLENEVLVLESSLEDEVLVLDSLLEVETKDINADISDAYVYDHYDKDGYEVTPTMQEQVLNTENKVLDKNVKVDKIPFYEIPNESGTTIVLG